MQKISQKQPASQQYQFLDKLGEGSFGYIWKVRHISSGQIYACKLVKNTMRKEKQLLQREIKILQVLKGFTQLIAYGSDTQNTYFVMHLLGENLDQLKSRHGNFKLSTYMSMAVQMIVLLRDLHNLNIVHRDIKPENFVVYQDKLHLIDFGLSKLYCHDNKHIEYKENKGMIGTARYASINALKGNEQSRRDDLESIGYLLLYLQNGTLPWINITADDRNIKYHKILKMKEALKFDQFFGLPPQLSAYFSYIKTLKFDQQPDYQLLINLFTQENLEGSPRLGLNQPIKVQIKPTLLRLKTIQTTASKCNTCRPSPQQGAKGGNNSSRRITFEDLSSEGADIIQELRFSEQIQIRNFDIGIKQPKIQQWSSYKESDGQIDEFDEELQRKFIVPKTLAIKE